ncbi:MAG: hypothetical protein AB1704_20420 [Pseudomonadota bacterium]
MNRIAITALVIFVALSVIALWKAGARKNKLVTAADLERVLDWLISIEPDPSAPDAMEQAKKNKTLHAARLVRTKEVIRRYANQIEPPTVEAMREEFYRITRRDKYTSDAVALSVVYATLHYGWNGINGWQA